MKKPNNGTVRSHQISDEERQKRAELRRYFNEKLVKSYPVGSILKKKGNNGDLKKGIKQMIVGVSIDVNHFNRPIFTLRSMKTGAVKPVMGDNIEAYGVINQLL